MRATLETLLDRMRENGWQSYDELVLRLADAEATIDDLRQQVLTLETGE